ncbi:MAG: methyltransferase domain-containing protein [Candidatus Brocadiae bacterium]|nr:methyltransferase domain-containing protein [Candidatus Brocadiia bacterium]
MTQTTDVADRAYLGWRNKYANEPARCRNYEGRFAGAPGRRVLSWLDARMVLRALRGVPRGSLILDLPCGGGRLTRALTGAGYRTLASDYSDWMCRESQPAAVAAVRADATRLPYRDGAFAASVCFRFLHSVPAPLRIASIRELGRVSGIVVLNYLNLLSIRSLRLFLGRRKPLKSRISETQAIAEVESAGLTVLGCEYKARFLFEDFAVVAKAAPAAPPSAQPQMADSVSGGRTPAIPAAPPGPRDRDRAGCLIAEVHRPD